jgi:hypothetical protein
MATPPNNEYELKKQMLEDIKTLTKEEHIELFRVIRKHSIEYSENSNGIFFDLTQCTSEIFGKLIQFMELCKTQRKNEELRSSTMESLRSEQLT